MPCCTRLYRCQSCRATREERPCNQPPCQDTCRFVGRVRQCFCQRNLNTVLRLPNPWPRVPEPKQLRMCPVQSQVGHSICWMLSLPCRTSVVKHRYATWSQNIVCSKISAEVSGHIRILWQKNSRWRNNWGPTDVMCLCLYCWNLLESKAASCSSWLMCIEAISRRLPCFVQSYPFRMWAYLPRTPIKTAACGH